MSVLSIDLDNFKRLNDEYGHQAGDEALIDVANYLRAQFRDYDSVARNGGDEFFVVCPSTPVCEATRIAERIRSGIEKYGETRLGAKKIAFGASVGVACFPEDADDIEALMARADAAMYRDKRSGKQGKMAA